MRARYESCEALHHLVDSTTIQGVKRNGGATIGKSITEGSMNIVQTLRIFAAVSGTLATAVWIAARLQISDVQRDKYAILKRLQGRQLQLFVLTLVFLAISLVAQVASTLSDSTIQRLESEAGRVSARVSIIDLEDELSARKAPGSAEARDYFAAGIRDLKAGRFSDAAQNFERSVRAVRTIVAYWALAAAQDALSQYADAEQTLLTASQMFTTNTPKELAASVLTSLANVEEEQGDFANAEGNLKKALALLGSQADSDALAEVHNGFGRIYADRSDLDRSLAEHSAALQIYERLKDVLGQGATLNNIGNVYVAKGPIGEALRYHDRALDLYRAGGDDLGRLRALNNIGNALADGGKYAEARKRYDESLALARSTGNQQGEARALNNIAELMRQSETDEHQLREALTLAERALSLSTERGFDDTAAHALVTMGNIYTNLGDRAQAERCFSSAASRYERFGNKNGVALATGNLAELFRIEERYDESIAASARVLTLYERAKDLKGLANTHLSIGNVHITRGEWPQAEASYAQALKIARQGGNPERTGRALAGLGDVYLQTNRSVESIANTESAITIFHGMPSPQDEAGALLNLALAHEKHGEYESAFDELSRAIKMYEKLPVPPDAQKVIADAVPRLKKRLKK